MILYDIDACIGRYLCIGKYGYTRIYLIYGIGNSTAYPSSRSESRKRALLVFLWYRKFLRLSESAKRISQSYLRSKLLFLCHGSNGHKTLASKP